jgi:SAM-dependent methyltransferase
MVPGRVRDPVGGSSGSPTATSASARRCQWCGEALDPSAGGLRGTATCARCGVATTDPLPSEAELERAYGEWYRPRAGRFAGPGDAVLRWSRGRLARRLDRIAPEGAILDVGAGDGTLLDALAARGRAAVGLERDASRSDVRSGEVFEVDGAWAAVVFWHSVEHLRDAGAALDHAAGLLAPGGVVVVAMPNAASIQARLLGARWLGLDLPRHIVHVPASALLERLRGRGLRVERVSHLRGGQVVFGWLHGLVASLPGHPDLYDAIRRREARRRPLSAAGRAGALGLAGVLLPIASACALVEAALRRGGSIYVEARRV